MIDDIYIKKITCLTYKLKFNWCYIYKYMVIHSLWVFAEPLEGKNNKKDRHSSEKQK